MNTGNLLVGAGLGAALAYMLDPDTGTRRRALLRDQLGRSEHVDDGTLLERVRSKLGRVCSHPRAIDVQVANGNVTLRGPILAGDVAHVLAAVSNVRGVRAVTNDLDTLDSSDSIPSLQGKGQGATSRFRSSPATQALVAAGVATGVWMYARR
jgi:hypothetical protein